MTSSIVVVVLAIAMAAVSITLTGARVQSARDQLSRSVRQLAAVTTAGLRTAQPRYVAAGRDAAVVAALKSPSPSAAGTQGARAVLARLQLPTDSGLPVELWNAAGKRVAFVGHDVPPIALGQEGQRPELPPIRPGLDSARAVDSLQLGALYRLNGSTYAWLLMPILVDGHPIGFIAQQRKITPNPLAEQTVRELSGDSAVAYYRNVDGSVWMTVGGRPSGPRESPARATGPSAGAISAEARIDGTPIMIRMEAQQRVVVAPVRATLRRLAAFGVGLALLAAVAAWLIGLWIARPLGALTDAADAVAWGDYAAEVHETGSHEVARLASTFNAMVRQVDETRSRLELANRAKSDFLAAMSHELRTPLNAIGGYAELIEMGLRGPVSEQQKHDLHRIRANQQYLEGLIANVLTQNRLEAGRVDYRVEAISVDRVLRELDALLLPQLMAKGLRIEHRAHEGEVVLRADGDKVRQILLNVLSNAVRHSPPDAAIAVAVARGDRDGSVSVCDAGPGIATDKLETVFEPFVQLGRSLNKPVDGAGLGLSISRELARGMGGDLTVVSVPGAGACFTLSLPLAAERDSDSVRQLALDARGA